MYSNNRVKIRKPPEQTVEYVVNWNHLNQLELKDNIVDKNKSSHLSCLHGCGVDNPGWKDS